MSSDNLQAQTGELKASAVLLPRLYERDIDCLLQEEILFNGAVRLLLSRPLQVEAELKVLRCELSVFDPGSGETDVLVWFEARGRRGIILIENKIDAAFQPRQAERYQERAAALMESERCEIAHCLLVAPSQYAKSGDEQLRHFDAVVSYEDIAGAIASETTPRSRHRAALLLRAVERSRAAYFVTPDEEATEFWKCIYALANIEFSQLNMASPGVKGGQSKWVIFKGNLPPRITIDWKIAKGIVDLSFWRGAHPQPKSTIDLSGLSIGAKLIMLGDTLAIRTQMRSPDEEWTKMPDERIREFLAAALELLRFYNDKPGEFE